VVVGLASAVGVMSAFTDLASAAGSGPGAEVQAAWTKQPITTPKTARLDDERWRIDSR